jgi:ABC-2 type transport system permease protein
MRALRLVATLVRVSVMNEMQYRANLLAHSLQSILALVAGLAVLGLVFSHVSELRGWSQPALVAVLGVFTLLSGVIKTFVKPNLIQFMRDVHEGTLDYVLTKPVDAQLLVSARSIQPWQGVDLLIGATLVAAAVARLDLSPSVADLLGFVAGLALGSVILYCFLLLLATTAFWFVRVDPIIELFDGVYQAGRWPIGVYPGWLRIGLTVVVPVGVAVTVPSQAVTSRLSAGLLLSAAAVAVVLVTVTRCVWRLGLRRYTSASS